MNNVNFYARFITKLIQKSMVSFKGSKTAKPVNARLYVYERAELGKKMNNKLNQRERRYLAAVKELPCGVCGTAGPSDAHHIVQHQQYLCIPLCKDCHQGSFNGIHGQKRIWNVLKKTELSVLNETIERLIK